MLHRIVSRSAVAFAAVGLLASCEDNTTGTPLPPFTPSTAVNVSPIEVDGGYGDNDTADTINGVDTIVTVVTPDPVFEVLSPEGDPAVGQIINFNVNLPGLLQQTRDTVDAAGFVSPGYWIVGGRPVQRVIATPAAGNTGFIDVSTVPPAPPEGKFGASR